MNTLTINKAMTKEEIIKSVCKYDFIESIELNDDITVSEALEAMQLYADQQTADKDKRIKELEEAAKSYIDKLEKELTSQLTEGVSLDVDGLNVALKKWSEVLTKINQTNGKS